MIAKEKKGMQMKNGVFNKRCVMEVKRQKSRKRRIATQELLLHDCLNLTTE